MGRCYPHLNLDERRNLAKWLEAKISIKEIADRLCRDASTIYREIKRNSCRFDDQPELNGYHALAAQDRSEDRRAVHRKLILYPEIMAAVRCGFDAGWSPEQIAGRMRLERHPMRVSHETIYRYAYSKAGRAEKFYRHLPMHRHRRRPRGTRRHHGRHILDELAIAHRPEAIAERDQFGHWECDLVMFRKEFGKANVTSLVERVSRFALVLKNPDRQSKPVMESLIANLSPLPAEARRSITFDRGTEFSAWQHLKDGLGVEPWFCDPQSPWQKGTVENTNNRLRRYLSRKADPTAFTDRYLRSICDRLNATPRKCLGYQTPAEVFRAKLMEGGP
ncbi:IS30-like element ISRssp4 family transposase [Roseovarius sp. 217]|uniref:IS30-like element ISRssp4 family transposase n=1 Tax=Roseovarius sp. (strain 217) TaxID=314264 RepID=UPI0000685592|nr:IS30-like element ISRssp4 family transposase [Roseovarius sp. 217]EAQ23486.1 TRm24 putative transposase [Roseovarius sp. 217]EAQ24724.1 TRm24 putative transposase [Roseovarius sp. 217]EAQ24933.1 TRm24 putative transposase [Roseovarius sp. 217]EAQ26474.1 TRm24 putative transposase [Roseovarius sp. 217]EAQ26907.1 TRm24 putative transposase [Roseovarius sp. 217]